MVKKLSIKKILSLFLIIMFVFSIFSISRASADTKAFQLTSAKLQDKSDDVVADVSLNESNIKTDVTFHKLKDYVIYKLTFKNNDNKDYVIKSITDDNTNPYVVYSYDDYKDASIKSGDSIDVLVKVTYDAEVTDLDKREIIEDVKLSFTIEDSEGNTVVSNVVINPKTNDNITAYVILSIISLGGLIILLVKNKNVKKTMMFVVLLSPFIVKAIDSSFEVVLNTDYKFFDKLNVTTIIDGEEVTKAVSYGDKITEPEEPIKDGYNFLGWYNGEDKYDFDSSVKDDITLTPKYETIKYTISFNYNGGIAINPIEYDVETDSITLVNPIKPGYSFSGWTGSNGDTYQTRVTIEKGSIGDLEFTANFSANDDTTYIVRHRYLNLDGETYVEEVEELTGTTDTTVRPQGKHKEGFVDKEDTDLENLVITGDGKAELIYVYDRVMVTLSYNEDVESDFAEGQYKYGTPITISATEKTGYTFNKWNVNTNGSPIFINTNDDENEISIGDVVIIGTDWFYVIAPPENGEVKLLPKFNLNSDARQSISSDAVAYSSSNYWNNSSDYTPFGSSSYAYIYRTTSGEETNNNLKTRINSYKDYLNGLNIVTVNDARLMSYEEALVTGCGANSINSCPTWVANQKYWLGSALDNYRVWNVDAYRRCSNGYYSNVDGGIRPVVIISSSDISTDGDSSTQATFSIEEDTYVEPSYKPNKDTAYKVVHKKQDQNDESVYTTETENKTGITGETITPDVKTTYESGYTVPNKETTTIAADGSTTVTYTYNYKYYNILYNANGGSVNTESQNLYKGSSFIPPTPTWSGYIFTGWYDQAEDGNLIVEPNESFTPTRSITLYAHWEVSNNPIAYLIDSDGDLDVSIGDEVHIGDDVFYYIGRDDNNNMKLLAKYNLDYNYKQTEEHYVSLTFSSTCYWASAGSSSSESSSSSDYNFDTDNEGYKYVYRDSNNNDISENNLKDYVNHYKSYIESETEIYIIDARLMTFEEATAIGCSADNDTCPGFASNDYQHYWLGSTDNDDYVWEVNGSNAILGTSAYDFNGGGDGVRPVIVVSEDDISMPWENNDTLLYSDANNDGNISLGDSVRIGSEGFRVIDTPSNGEVKLLAMYNLNDAPRQSLNSDIMSYSSSNYWHNSSDYTPFGSSSYNYIYRTTANRFTTDGDTNNNLKTRINSYKDYLNGLNIVTVNDARLMSYEEAVVTGCDDYNEDTCPTWVANEYYWLGSALNEVCVWYVYANTRHLYDSYYNSSYYSGYFGVRPVITINESDIPTN